MENIIEIKRVNLLKKSDYFILLNYTVFTTLGIVSIFWDWQASIGPLIVTILILIIIRKVDIWSYIIWFIFGFISLSFFLSWIFNLSFGIFLLQTACFTAVKPAISTFKGIGRDRTDIVFSLNSTEFMCLLPENNDYKGYAMNPMGYRKWFKIADIISVKRDRQNLVIALRERLIRPRELNTEDVDLILNFFQARMPHLTNTLEPESVRREEERIDWVKLTFIAIPAISAGLAIYFFADNGRNFYSTILVVFLAILVAVVLLKIINQSNHTTKND